ncbi:MAG: hypothetical protein J6Q05_06655 [Elusimicrobiaceae bacterium]|nr:hypothetical protein [Elusimicrobiaceae bacterium]
MNKYTLCLTCCLLTLFQLLSTPVFAQNRRFSQALERRVQNVELYSDQLIDAVENPAALRKIRPLLDRGADPCKALPSAVFAKNAEAIKLLAQYQGRCNWKAAVEKRLPYVIKNNLIDVFSASLFENRTITCPDPFNFTPAQNNSQWNPLSPQMLAAVTQHCFLTQTDKETFLRHIILLNAGKNNIFQFGETYKYGIRSNYNQQRWLVHISQLLRLNIPVSNETLRDVISQSRVPNIYDGDSKVPFEITRKLVKLCLRGKADGPAVLNWLNSSQGKWVWENYSSQERMYLSNLLENKPEMQPRTFADRMCQLF